jgi:hypothetical protein
MRADELAAPDDVCAACAASLFACGSFGYCRERSFTDDGRVNLPNDETARQQRNERRIRTDDYS